MYFSGRQCMLQTVALVEELLSQLPDATAAAQFTVVCADVDTADLASRRLRNAVAVLDPEDSGVTGGPLLIVAPRPDQVDRKVDPVKRAPPQRGMAPWVQQSVRMTC